METESGVVLFRLPICWDIAARVLKHTARNGRTRLRIHRHGNGYLQLQLTRTFRPTISIDIMFLAERDSATRVLAVDVTKGLRVSRRERQYIEDLLEQFRSDAEFFEAHLDYLDETANRNQILPRSSWTEELPRLRGAALDLQAHGTKVDMTIEVS